MYFEMMEKITNKMPFQMIDKHLWTFNKYLFGMSTFENNKQNDVPNDATNIVVNENTFWKFQRNQMMNNLANKQLLVLKMIFKNYFYYLPK